jgi:DNA helicase-2/ATP-dependent DNA helicase PcrA
VPINYQSSLNPAQLKAVLHENGPMLVLAGAGSGKTRTLVYRVARLVEHGVTPDSILLLTFTRRAAEEMLFRASSLLDGRCKQVEGGTFHSVAHRLLRLYAEQLGLPSAFTILDRSDAEDIISWIRKDKGLSRRELGFPQKRTLADLFSRATNTGIELEELILRRYTHLSVYIQDIFSIHQSYTAHKLKNGLLDYDDLLVFCKLLLQEHDRVRRAVTERYRYVLVDEFQDTNHLQADIVELLSGIDQNVMVVGDDSQSIYSFRGARFKNIIEFPKRFPNAVIVKLEQNYRSTQPVLDVANRIIACASTAYTKCLFTIKKDGPPPVVCGANDEHSQSILVADGVSRLLDEGVQLHEIAVLFRSAYHSFDLEVELNNRGYPFVKYGGFKFLELAHIKDVLAHLKVVVNPRDLFSWQRILLLVPGVGMARATRILEQAKSHHSMLEGFSAASEVKHAPKLVELADLLIRVKNTRNSPRERLELIVDYYQPILESTFDDHPKRARHLQELLTLAERFKKSDDFLAEVTLEPPQEERSSGRRGEALTLSTIHSAKGLEWKAVFVLWAAEGWFPGIQALESEDELEEERRLMYVAVTRAEKYLYLCYPKSVYRPGEGRLRVLPSRFIRDFVVTEEAAPAVLPGREEFLVSVHTRYGGILSGRKVRHPTFGEGRVVALQGPDGIMVDFEKTGIIRLHLKYAPLEIIDE